MSPVVIFYILTAAGVVFVAEYAPKLVNGLLILILVGMILKHAGVFDTFIKTGTNVARIGGK